MKIESIKLRRVKLDLVEPFAPSFGTLYDKDILIVELYSEGLVGYGECPALSWPLYNEETVYTAQDIIIQYIAPLLKKLGDIKDPFDISKEFKHIRRNFFARSAIETAIFDLFTKKAHQKLYDYIGGVRDKVRVGISIGIKNTPEELLKSIEKFKDQGYQRFKLKIKPNYDIRYLEKVREKYPNIILQVDANSAYTLNDIETLKALDAFNLVLIEQPLAFDDIVHHSILQKNLKTPICLDECIDSIEDAKVAIELKAAKIINIKVARVGGLANAKEICQLCENNDIGVWCGGMLETDIGQAYNLASASLKNYIYENDIMSSDSYFKDNLTEEKYIVDKDNSTIAIPQGIGLGVNVDLKKLDKYTYSVSTINLL